MRTTAFLLLAALIITSCNKSEIKDAPLTSPGVIAKIDNASVDFGIPMAEKQVSTEGNTTIFLSASSTGGNSIEISLSKQNGLSTGSYSVSNAAFIGISDGDSYYATDNNVNITIVSVDDTKVVGNFSGVVRDAVSGTSKAITSGKFYAIF